MVGEEQVLSVTVTQSESGKRIARIRTHDRIQYLRCRRAWNWSSPLRHYLEPKDRAPHFWFGSGGHFSLEDFHGPNHFGRPSEAFRAYVDATRRAGNAPPDWEEHLKLGIGMLDYYVEWLDNGRSPLNTLWINGKPQLEVNFSIRLPWDPGRHGWDEVYYDGTFDRVAIDEYSRLWLVEYKFPKAFETIKIEIDSQVNSYCWAGQLWYGKPFAGVVYQQHKKNFPHEPEFLKSTGKFSVNKKQVTTFTLYKRALERLYTKVQLAPKDNQEFLSFLSTQENERADSLIRRDYLERNANQIDSEYAKITAQVAEMLNPETPIYNNPMWLCSAGAATCGFFNACIMMDDGSDYQHEIDTTTVSRANLEDRQWRQYLQLPQPSQQL